MRRPPHISKSSTCEVALCLRMSFLDGDSEKVVRDVVSANAPARGRNNGGLSQVAVPSSCGLALLAFKPPARCSPPSWPTHAFSPSRLLDHVLSQLVVRDVQLLEKSKTPQQSTGLHRTPPASSWSQASAPCALEKGMSRCLFKVFWSLDILALLQPP